MKYEIGDVVIFHSMPDKEWLLLDYNEKTYYFVNLWNPKETWTSHRSAPIHKSIPIKHYKNRENNV